MSVRVRKYRKGGWEVDITCRLPNGSRMRERCKAPASSKSAAQRWGEERERHLIVHGPPQVAKEVPTLRAFAPRFVEGHARANRHRWQRARAAGSPTARPGQPETRRDQDGGRAAVEGQAAGEVPEDGQQR